MHRRKSTVVKSIVVVLVVVVSQLCTGENSKVLLYVADGMVPELVTKFISEGVMPNLAKIMDLGASAPHGITPPLPPNTGVSWPTIFTGAFAGSHGITNNSFHNVNDPINVSGWSWAGANRAESIVEAAEKDGLTAVVVGGPWPSWPPEMAGISGPVLTWEYWWTKPGVITNYAIPEAWMAPYLIVDYHQVDLGDAETCPIQSFSPPKSTTIEPSQYLGPAVWHWNVYVVDTTDDTLVNYDAVYLYDDDACLGILREGEWVYIPVEYEGKKGGVELKLIDLDPQLDRFRIYYTASRGIQAHPPELEQELQKRFRAPIAADRDPLIAGLIDETTWMEQARMEFESYNQIYEYLVQEYSPDLFLAGTLFTDEVQHRLYGYINPKSPLFDPKLSSTRWHYIRQAYMWADEQVGRLWDAMGRDQTVVFCISDHGFACFWKRLNINLFLQNLGLYDPSNVASSQAVAYAAGGCAQIYINLSGREPTGVVPPKNYESLVNSIIEALLRWTDPETGDPIISRVFRKEELAYVEEDGLIQNLLNQETSGDIVVFTNPPYQFDAPEPGVLIAPAIPYFNGQHGYLPGAVPPDLGNVRAVFLAAGEPIARGVTLTQGGLWDIAPTIACILGISVPANADGKPLGILKRGE